MLREVPHPDSDTRKFIDEELELYVWSEHGQIAGFQLWYDKRGTERAILWSTDIGFEHAALQPGSTITMAVPGGEPDAAHALREFATRSESLDETIRRFVLTYVAAFR